MESVSTNKTARVTNATIYSKLGAMIWYIERLAYLEKAGDTPHTLHERRSQNNPDQNDDTQMAPQTLSQNNLHRVRIVKKDKSKHKKDGK